MKNIDTILFTDAETGEAAAAIIGAGETSIRICLSLEHDGDIEAFLSPKDAKQLLVALERAIDASRNDTVRV